MAIKITGTTVINDSRVIENITDIKQIVRTPSILSPENNETDTENESLVITGTTYSALFPDTRNYREFQVDLATGDFSTPVVSDQENSDSLTLSTNLTYDTEYKARIRDVDHDGTVSPFSDVVTFTTQVDPLSIFGAAACGGFYMGTVDVASTCYALIVAPNSTGCAFCQYKTTESSTSGASSTTDGYYITYEAMQSSSYPAGNWTATRTINGFSDWYLPAIGEISQFYSNGAGNGSGDPLPAGEDFSLEDYWSSTEDSNTRGYYFHFGEGASATHGGKDYTENIRAVRRVPFS